MVSCNSACLYPGTVEMVSFGANNHSSVIVGHSTLLAFNKIMLNLIVTSACLYPGTVETVSFGANNHSSVIVGHSTLLAFNEIMLNLIVNHTSQ